MVSLRYIAKLAVAYAGKCVVVPPQYPIKAVCELTPTVNHTVHGTVKFTQHSADLTTIEYNLVSDSPGTSHGFHIHAVGDTSDNCAAAGGHYNPFNGTHGAPWDTVRHVGDLAMLTFDDQGSVQGSQDDRLIKLEGKTSVVGRSVVLHAGKDDYGKGGNEGSLANGNAGAREACCIIQKA